MKTKSWKYLLGMGMASCMLFVASANLVIDGNFTAAGNPGSYTTYSAGSMGGWTVVSGSVDLIGTYWQSPAGGGNSVDMAGNSSGTINQTINGLVVGQVYQLTFALSGNPDGAPTVKDLGVGLSFGGSSPFAFSYTTGGNTLASMNYVIETEDFTANNTSEVLQFQDQSSYNGSTPYGAVIGNVNLTAVPEASTVIAGALLLLPFGASTLRILRRNRVA
jgi:choice-of-anchor C domain-containing protein